MASHLVRQRIGGDGMMEQSGTHSDVVSAAAYESNKLSLKQIKGSPDSLAYMLYALSEHGTLS